MRPLNKFDKIAIISFGICFIGLIVFLNKIYKGDYTGILGYLYTSNIKIYVFATTLFFFSFVAINKSASIILKKLEFEQNKSSKRRELPFWAQVLISGLFSLVGIVLYLHWEVVAQWEEVGVSHGSYYDFPILFRVIVAISFFTGMIVLFVKKQDILDISLYLLYFWALIIPFMQIYINPFVGESGMSRDFSVGMPDNTSVTETIFNVYDGIPFDYHTSGIYGHYGLLFAIPLRLLGRCTPQKVIFLLALGQTVRKPDRAQQSNMATTSTMK